MNSPATPQSRGSRIVSEGLGYAVVAAGVWMAWQVIQTPVTLRGPPAVAIRLAPNSPEVLGRAAEAELTAGRLENARDLSEDSLGGAPFNASVLRVRGLVEAQSGDVQRADDILTLAGNWSLRDDPAHAWLVERRLRRGDFTSAFAHADTLARRRPDLYPRLFELFRIAATDRRGLNALTTLLAKSPPWRKAFLDDLFARKDGDQLTASLAILLERTKTPLSADELQQIHSKWAAEGKFEGLRGLREQMRRPSLESAIVDGDFESSQSNRYPFGWLIGAGPGVNASIVEDDFDADNLAVRFSYDGVGSTPILDQLLLLRPGRYALRGRMRMETAGTPSRMVWVITCIETGARLGQYAPDFPANATGWRAFQMNAVVPSEGCTAQSLALVPRPGDRRTTISGWVDDLRLSPAAGE